MSCMSAYSMPLCTIFTKWPDAVGADEGAAGLVVDVGGDDLEEGPELAVGVAVAPRHDRRALERADLAAGDADPDEPHPLLGERVVAAHGVPPVGVARVDDDVALVEQREELVERRRRSRHRP